MFRDKYFPWVLGVLVILAVVVFYYAVIYDPSPGEWGSRLRWR